MVDPVEVDKATVLVEVGKIPDIVVGTVAVDKVAAGTEAVAVEVVHRGMDYNNRIAEVGEEVMFDVGMGKLVAFGLVDLAGKGFELVDHRESLDKREGPFGPAGMARVRVSRRMVLGSQDMQVGKLPRQKKMAYYRKDSV